MNIPNSAFFPHYKGAEFQCKPDCPGRHPGCQSHCKNYLSVAEKRKPYQEEYAKRRVVSDYISDHDNRQKSKYKKK